MELNLANIEYITKVCQIGNNCVILVNRELSEDELDEIYGELWDQGLSEDTKITMIPEAKKSIIDHNPELNLIVNEGLKLYEQVS